MQDTQVQSLDWEELLEEEMATHSCLKNSMDRGTWQAIVNRVAKSWAQLIEHFKNYSTIQ